MFNLIPWYYKYGVIILAGFSFGLFSAYKYYSPKIDHLNEKLVIERDAKNNLDSLYKSSIVTIEKQNKSIGDLLKQSEEQQKKSQEALNKAHTETLKLNERIAAFLIEKPQTDNICKGSLDWLIDRVKEER